MDLTLTLSSDLLIRATRWCAAWLYRVIILILIVKMGNDLVLA